MLSLVWKHRKTVICFPDRNSELFPVNGVNEIIQKEMNIFSILYTHIFSLLRDGLKLSNWLGKSFYFSSYNGKLKVDLLMSYVKTCLEYFISNTSSD